MHAVIRRYEGVTDPAEAGRRVHEEFLPLLRQVQGSWPTTSSMPAAG